MTRCLFHKTLEVRISLWDFWGFVFKVFPMGTPARREAGRGVGRLSAIRAKVGWLQRLQPARQGIRLPFLSNVTDCIAYGCLSKPEAYLN